MEYSIEHVLRDLLVTRKNSMQVAEDLSQRLSSEQLSAREVRDYLNFLILSGYYKDSLKIFALLFKNKRPIPWQLFLEMLRRSGFKPGKEFLNHLLHAMDDNNQKFEFYIPWNSISPELKSRFELYMQNKKNKSQNIKNKLFEKLDFFNSQHMFDEEVKLIKDLQRRYPHAKELNERAEKLELNWARTYVSESMQKAKDKELFTSQEITPIELKDSLKILTSHMEEIALTKMHYAYDFSLGLFFMDAYPEALRLINLAPQTLGTDWFRIELLIRAKNYLECLDSIHYLEAKYADDPESIFAATYYRAKIFRGLGQNATAQELLRSIVSIRPNYRAASALLIEWTH